MVITLGDIMDDGSSVCGSVDPGPSWRRPGNHQGCEGRCEIKGGPGQSYYVSLEINCKANQKQQVLRRNASHYK